MVKEKLKDGKAYFICEACGFAYLDTETTQRCEDWCNKHHSCNLEITKDAVKAE